MLRHASKMILGQGLRSPSMRAVAVGAGTLRMYHERVVDHYSNPRNVGSFDKNDSNVGTGLVGAPACGDVMKLQIRVDEESGKIVDACFKTFGCGSAIASSSVATEWVKGKQMEEVLSIKNTEIAKHLSLPPVKLHCSMLAEDAIKAAVKDYESKRGKSNASEEAASLEKAADA
ncbi:iron-sulfur cluster assembly 1-like [Olea europaea subsp. europaea]|uniref:Iron-sulfur cluster assembly protein n=1 Tax=Olea europaea subsp. europaea TaxID=158383 RepID=A0A8S0PI43_OLEEU|nr:iron-sulfur cluster assembly 1-like [Olea europaea subsp. europaea]